MPIQFVEKQMALEIFFLRIIFLCALQEVDAHIAKGS